MTINETAGASTPACESTPTSPRSLAETDPPGKFSAPPRSRADVLRDRLRGVKSARRLISEAKTVARWRCDSESLFALARASEWLGRERMKLLEELEREEAEW